MPQSPEGRKRAAQALEWREQGETWVTIAKRLGVSRERARQLGNLGKLYRDRALREAMGEHNDA